MKPVREIVSREIIDDLWGAGYTILPRRRGPDPFEIDPRMVPEGRSYQWMHLVQDKVWIDSGWAAVPASRHDGYFMPAGHVGDIEVNGLGLFEKPKFEVDQAHEVNVKAAHKQVEDWIDKNAALGISGSVSFGGVSADVGDPDVAKKFTTADKTIETAVKIPKDMIPHMAAIFAERDRLRDEVVQENNPNSIILRPGEIADKFKTAVDADDSRPRWPTLLAILLPIAIQNVRKALANEEKTS